ncbi:altronate hydrolase [Sphingomonas sp. DBB INV C78]|uniref:UxaA family hydrolase n=1 Tax=Sphingomonas sp. DBB INV C78 TaxID=3349434 RepID=UPI0036D320F4
MQLPAAIRIDRRDSVAIALRGIAADEIVTIDGEQVRTIEAIARGHKFALSPIEAGAPVLKFGFPIGIALAPIASGAHVHTHNVTTALSGTATEISAVAGDQAGTAAAAPHFLGYRRPDGRVATRNEIWILPTVGCVARTAEKIAATARDRHAGRIDGVHAFAHPFGCSQLGADLEATRAILAGLAQNPNAGGVLILGLGCESNQMAELVELIPPDRRGHIRTLAAQGVEDEVAAGLALIDELVAIAGEAQRESLPLADIVLGVKCGGSDGFSGLTANPLVGRVSDAVTRGGGTAILTEIPEIFGAEHLLVARAADGQVADFILGLVDRFKRYFIAYGEPVSENPSPGNIAGGITTLEEKSLGAVQKAGHAIVTDVIDYGGHAHRPGLTLLEAPGNDAVSSTALAAAGATAILFTTGRGTPLGFPVPTIKIASNSDLANRKAHWIDFDAGPALTRGLDAMATDLIARLAVIASGEPTAAERNDEREIAIWKRGVTL